MARGRDERTASAARSAALDEDERNAVVRVLVGYLLRPGRRYVVVANVSSLAALLPLQQLQLHLWVGGGALGCLLICSRVSLGCCVLRGFRCLSCAPP